MQHNQAKVTFRELGIQFLIPQSLLHNPQMYIMVPLSFRVREDVMTKHYHKRLYIRSKHDIH